MQSDLPDNLYDHGVYIVNTYDINDLETFEKYLLRVLPLLEKHKVTVLVMEMNPKAPEGVLRIMNAIIGCPSQEALNDFYNDPGYRSFINVRWPFSFKD